MYDSELQVAIKAAKNAGLFLKNQNIATVDSEKGKDIKLNLDRESERLILEELSTTGISVFASISQMNLSLASVRKSIKLIPVFIWI